MLPRILGRHQLNVQRWIGDVFARYSPSFPFTHPLPLLLALVALTASRVQSGDTFRLWQFGLAASKLGFQMNTFPEEEPAALADQHFEEGLARALHRCLHENGTRTDVRCLLRSGTPREFQAANVAGLLSSRPE